MRASASRKPGMKIHTEAKVAKLSKGKDCVTATIEFKDGKKEDIKADRVISAVGVVGNIENLGLEKLGVKIDRGTIVIDRLRPDQRPRHLRHRRRRRPADARPQGGARGRHLRRGDRRPEAAPDGQARRSPAAPTAIRRSPRSA